MRRESTEFAVAVVDIDPSELWTALHNINIVNASPLIRLGFASIRIDTTVLAECSISAFTTGAQADAKISKAKIGDVIFARYRRMVFVNRPNLDHLPYCGHYPVHTAIGRVLKGLRGLARLFN